MLFCAFFWQNVDSGIFSGKKYWAIACNRGFLIQLPSFLPEQHIDPCADHCSEQRLRFSSADFVSHKQTTL